MTFESFPSFYVEGMYMGKEESAQNYIIIKAVIVLSLVCLCMYGIQGIYGFSLFPDEFGYWASAANALGFDFSEITSIGSYYSFGYSLILIPIMHFFQDSIIAYRAAVVINLLLQIASFFLIIKITEEVFKESDKTFRLILSGIAVLYPSWIFYTQMTMSEALLFFMYTLVTFLMLRYLKKPSLGSGIALAIASVYMYTVHMRTIGVLFSVALTIVVDAILRIRNDSKEKAPAAIIKSNVSVIVIALVLLIGYLLSLHIKTNVVDTLYTSGAVNNVYVNDYSGQVGKIKDILSLSGIGKFLLSMAGKILYLGCATFGFGLIGVYSLVKRSLNKDKNASFILLTSLAQFMVMCIYLIDSANIDANRFDLFLHGRYFDFAVPMLMIFGINEIVSYAGVMKKMAVAAIVVVICGTISIIVSSLNRTGFSDPHGMLMIGMSYFLDEDNVMPLRTIARGILLAVVISLIFLALIWAYKKYRNSFLLLITYIAMIGLSYHALNHFIYIGQTYIYGDIQIADQISDLRQEGYKGDIVLLYEGGLEYIDTVQLRLRDEHIHVQYIDGSEKHIALRGDDLILVYFESDLNNDLSQIYDKSWESGHFDLYYNEAGGSN